MEHEKTLRTRKINLGKIIDTLHDKNGRGGVARMAEILGRTSGYVSQLMSLSDDRKKSRPVTEKTARQIEEALQLPKFSMDQDAAPTPSDAPQFGPSTGKVPLISWVQAGDLCEAEDPYAIGAYESLEDVHVEVKEGMYALRVKGHSMTSPSDLPSYPNGIIIVVDPNKKAENGDDVIAKDGKGQVTFKTLSIESDGIFLTPLNPDYKPIEIKDELIVCGVIVEAFFKR